MSPPPVKTTVSAPSGCTSGSAPIELAYEASIVAGAVHVTPPSCETSSAIRLAARSL
jgi:hypothetical protein